MPRNGHSGHYSHFRDGVVVPVCADEFFTTEGTEDTEVADLYQADTRAGDRRSSGGELLRRLVAGRVR